MKASLKSRRGRIVLLLGLLCLAGAVFSWGLSYKLSLYNVSSSSSRPVESAKLLSQRERPSDARAAAEQPPSPAPAQPIALLWIALAPVLALLRAVSTRVALVEFSPRARMQICLTSFFFRPPPALRTA